MIKEVVFPDTVTVIGENAFSFTKITEAVIPPLVTEIQDGVFVGTCIEELIIPGSVKTIGEEAFGSNDYLKTVVIEEGVEVLDENAIGSCDALESLTLPSTLTEETHVDAFWGSGSVETPLTIYVPFDCVMKDAFMDNYSGYDWCGVEVIE